MTRPLLPFLAGAALLLSAVGCDGGGASRSSSADRKIPDAFSYETTRPVDVLLRVRDTEGTPVPDVPLRLVAEQDGMEVPTARGATDEAGRFEVRLSRPVDEPALIARSSYLGIADSVRVPIRDGRSTHTFGGDVTELTATFVTRAVGASFANGFGFALPIEPSTVEQVSGTDLREGIVTTRPNGTEAGTDNAVIVVYDDVHNRTSRAGGFFNTDPAVPYRPPDTIRVEVTFQPAVPSAQLGTAPYNPFIFVNGDRSREVHLPDEKPTAKASAEWFGQSQDASDPDAERFYKTRTNRPWALRLPSSFRYPKEKVGIRSGYLQFQDWAESGGQQSQDWHSNTALDYRRPQKLYSPP